MTPDITTIEIIHGLECIITQRPRYVLLCVRGRRIEFHGRNREEVALLLWNYLHRRARYKSETRDIEADIREMLQLIRLPKEPVRISAGHIKPGRGRRESWLVVRCIGHHDGRVYFGTYFNIHAAKAASIRLCKIINEEIENRNAVLSANKRSTTP